MLIAELVDDIFDDARKVFEEGLFGGFPPDDDDVERLVEPFHRNEFVIASVIRRKVPEGDAHGVADFDRKRGGVDVVHGLTHGNAVGERVEPVAKGFNIAPEERRSCTTTVLPLRSAGDTACKELRGSEEATSA